MPVLTNQILNPSAEGATASLENQTGSTVTISTVSASGWPLDGTQSYLVSATATTDATARLRLVERAPAVAGQPWHLRGKLRAASGNTGTRRFLISLPFYNIAPGATAGTVLAGTVTQTVDLAPGAVADIVLVGVAPAGTLSVGATVSRVGGVLSSAAADAYFLDMLALVQADAALADSVQYFNPALVPLSFWNGTVNASTSTLYSVAWTLNVFNDENPTPRVQIVVADLPPQGDALLIRRTAEDELDAIVRDANMNEYAGTFTVEDAEAPLGLTMTYSVEVYSGDTLLGTSPITASTTIPVLDQLVAYIHDPLDPSSSVRGLIDADFGGDLGTSREGSYAFPGGATGGGVLLAGAFQGYVDIPLSFYSEDRDAARAFRALMKQTPVACLRIGAPIDGFPKTLYVALLNPRSTVLDQDSGFTRWTWKSNQIIAPKSGIIVPLHSYDDYMAVFTTYDAAMAVFATYIDAILNPPPAV